MKKAEVKKSIGGYTVHDENGNAVELFKGKGAKKAAEDWADILNAKKDKQEKKSPLHGSRERGGGRGGRA